MLDISWVIVATTRNACPVEVRGGVKSSNQPTEAEIEPTSQSGSGTSTPHQESKIFPWIKNERKTRQELIGGGVKFPWFENSVVA